eukprot:TRINITY_DN2748_c0_g1_i2.p1 TRINITY_DN2748_c0_g1~~TRINITY_DN2748_c0_g1_i2.p1  ORF type:complete len:249 (+),score=106.61 TRINITY_DN2748_c0_g1_i2:658-1404(+)
MVRMLPREFDRISGHLSVDGVGVGILDVATLTTRYTTSVFEGWLGDVTGSSRSTRRFRVGLPRTKAVWGDGGAAADAEEDAATAAVGSAVLKWCPSRLTSSYVTPSSGLVPDDAPTLSEREAMKNRSLATGVGSSLATPFNPMQRKRAYGATRQAEEIVVFYRERRVLVTRGILTEGGEVVPELRGKAGAGAAKAGAAHVAGIKAEGAPAGVPAKAEGGAYGGGSVAGPTQGSVPKKRKATSEIIIID